MKQCWRWFGPDDPIPLGDLPQVGVQGIVTALHHIAPGEPWTDADIADRQALLASHGFAWDVVESLPVSEAIKTQGAEFRAHVDAYKISLRELAARGITTICYNFMPILDWTRTQVRAPQPHGGTAMAFDLVDFAVFDLHMLKRADAPEDYDESLRAAAEARFRSLTDTARLALQKTIIMGLPGANDSWTLGDVSERLRSYDGIDPDRLRGHLVDFLSETAPLAEDLGVRLCCHPDDPPFSLLGLPRVMSSTEDYRHILSAVDLQANGATLCSGSLGVAREFDAPGFVRDLGARIHFAHLRNTRREPGHDPARPNFVEAEHLNGDTDMVATVRALSAEEDRRRAEGRADWQIPMRPDHGQELLMDRDVDSLPGYPLIGRLRGLAELRGIMATC